MSTNTLAETTRCTTIEVGGILYVPHYALDNTYVGPGHPRHNPITYTFYELMRRPGARRVATQLWSSYSRAAQERYLISVGLAV